MSSQLATQVANTGIGTVAGTIAAVAGVVSAVTLLIGALTIFLPVLRATRANGATLTEVHTMVNQQRTDLVNYQAALVGALKRAGVDVPEDQSKPPIV